MARGRKSSWRIVLSPEERQTLERWQRSTTIAAGLVRRGKIILLLAAGHSHSHVAQAIGVQRAVVRQWARRFLAPAPTMTTSSMLMPPADGISSLPRTEGLHVSPQRQWPK